VVSSVLVANVFLGASRVLCVVYMVFFEVSGLTVVSMWFICCFSMGFLGCFVVSSVWLSRFYVPWFGTKLW